MRSSDTRAHEEGPIRAFILPPKRDRFPQLLQSPSGRQKLIRSLCHFQHLDPQACYRMPRLADDQQLRVEWALALLQERGAQSTCYVLAWSDLDGQIVDLRTALEALDSSLEGAFQSCIPGTLGYFQDEHFNQRCVLERRSR